MLKSFKYRPYPTKAQVAVLEELLETARRLYNNALAQRRDSYQKNGRTLNYYDQANELRDNRIGSHFLSRLNYSACQDVLRRLDKSFAAFYRRVKNGEKAGYPRFKGRNRFDSLTFPKYGDGCKVKNNRLYLQNVGLVKVKWHRAIEGEIKTITAYRKTGKWYVIFSCEIPLKELEVDAKYVGIDLGLKYLAITSDGTFYEHPRYFREAERRLKRKQRTVTRRKKGSHRRRKAIKELARLHEIITNQRKDYAHKVSRELVNRYSIIAFEDLNVQGLIKNHHLAKSIVDASWNQLVQYTTYKAEEAGRCVVLVDPRNTSQLCSNCGHIVPKTLSERIHRCDNCGYVQDRDINAAQNILKRALAG